MAGTDADHSRGEGGAIIAAVVGGLFVVAAALIPVYLHNRDDGSSPQQTQRPPTTSAAVYASKDSGARGTDLYVSGEGFQPGERVRITVDTYDVATTTASGTGTFKSVRITIPDSEQPDWHATITATGLDSVRWADTQFYVSG